MSITRLKETQAWIRKTTKTLYWTILDLEYLLPVLVVVFTLVTVDMPCPTHGLCLAGG
ncbi:MULTISPECIES: hypothetical protein [Moorena]|uniref:hypothetical protein n=1 Tax=Moorena TaxID=1155738 RepID=UPI0013BCCF4C|nr:MULTISPECIES: hypothetical protein [Moorena]NER87654.1 hypothetical protein [Moorena sp. SIO3A2]